MASARAGNVIGGGDWSEDRLVSDIVRSFTAGEPVRIRQPNAVRPWQHVLDAISGYLLLTEQLSDEPGQKAEGFNFGPPADDAKPVSYIVNHVASLWGGNWSRDADPGPHEARFLRLDSSKARETLGWRPRLTLDDALEWIVAWHRAYDDGVDMRAITLQQIDRYQGIETNIRELAT